MEPKSNVRRKKGGPSPGGRKGGEESVAKNKRAAKK